jgi:hypothetical protein
MKKLLFVTVLLMTACGGGSANGPVTPPIVLAQNSFSAATLTGNYVFSGYMQNMNNTNTLGDVLGNLQFNGAGFITGGSFVDEYLQINQGGGACGPINVLSGSTYSVNATTGALTASLVLNAAPSSCGVLLPSGISGYAQQNGQGFVFVGTNGIPFLSGTALKQ